MGDTGKFSASKILSIILVCILVPAICFVAVVDGIVSTVVDFFKNLAGNIINGTLTFIENLKQFFGFSVVKDGMYIYAIGKDNVSALKDQLEAQQINTENAGLTETMLRKILLAHAVTSSTKDTLCVAEISEEDILNDTGYSNLNDFFNTCTKISSDEKGQFPISKPKYDLYYITDRFFYFQDEDNMIGKGEDLYYLGILGTTEVTTETGDSMGYVSNTEFEEIKNRYEQKGNKEGSQEEFDLLHHYTYDENGEMTVYKIIKNENKYKYIFNRNNDELVNKDGTETNSTYEVIPVTINVQNSVDSSQYTVSMELLINFLTMTGSPQYIDEFIDYALENTKVTIKGYSITTENITYGKDTYEIPDNFIFEAYDMVEGLIDKNDDNMLLYKELIYDRIYEGNRFDYSVVKLRDFDSIDYGTKNVVDIIDFLLVFTNQDYATLKNAFVTAGYDTEEKIKQFLKDMDQLLNQGKYYDEETANQFIEYMNTGKVSSVAKISDYLKCAYDPGTGFSLGKVEAQEITINERYETSWEFYIDSISTWYGDITYDPPLKSKVYSIDAVECEETEYNNFDYNSLTNYEDIEEKEVLSIFIHDKRANEVGITANENTRILNNSDILSSILNKDLGNNKNENFEYWRLRGLGLISADDKGQYNSKTGASSGSDYLYTKYKRSNAKRYNNTTKYATDVIEVSTNLPKVNTNKVYNFLALWKNETGAIGNTVYKSDGIKVKYSDIYNGTTEVGDIFESAPEMTFELLEKSDNTKSLVDIFKYIMYIYTGIDYGITDASQIAFIFSTVPYGGSDYNVNTTLSADELVLTKDQLTDAIEKTYPGEPLEETRKNLLSCVDDFIYIQENNKVNAVFAVAVTIIESSGGTNWVAIDPSTYNWYSIKGSYNGNSNNGWRVYSSFNESVRDFGNLIANGSYYFKTGKFTVSTIAPTYCNETWGNNVIAEMTKIYNSIGITGATGGTEGSTGNNTTFTVGGRTYINYKQIEPSYKSIQLATYPNSTLYSAGCGITSDAIIASGFGSKLTPVGVNSLGSRDHAGILTKLTGHRWTRYRSFNKTDVVNSLKSGNPVIARVEGYGGFFSSSGHFFAILSISEDGNSIYVSDPASRKNSRNGWMKTSILDASGYVGYIKMEG